jgi:hypothetical protein
MPDDQKFLADIQSDNADTRFAAWRAAGSVSAAVIPQLGRLAANEKPGVARAAREALTTMAHAVGKDLQDKKRPEVVKGLLELTGSGYALPARVLALRLLSGIAGEDSVPAIAKWIQTPELFEEAVYCLERIPGEASVKALMAAYPAARDEFKPRLLAALGHLRARAAAGLCAEAMKSSNLEIAVAGVKAYGRIGVKAAPPPKYPEPKTLSEWQRIEEMDSLLRYADAQVEAGNAADAMAIYKTALAREEEHWQCAAVIGLAKIGTPEAAAAILPKTKSTNRTVRITAANAWKSMAAEKA